MVQKVKKAQIRHRIWAFLNLFPALSADDDADKADFYKGYSKLFTDK
jgi:hypothetical protein